ncbi:hypothetical protein D3C87_880680 [compost metagenome]
MVETTGTQYEPNNIAILWLKTQTMFITFWNSKKENRIILSFRPKGEITLEARQRKYLKSNIFERIYLYKKR